MSAGIERSEVDDDSALLPEPLRTVTPSPRGRRDTGMDLIGWGIFLGILILFLPLLPVIAVLWLFSKLLERIGERRA